MELVWNGMLTCDYERTRPDATPLAVRLADPKDDFATLHTALGSASAAAAWRQRAEALAAYRAAMTEEPGAGLDAILTTLLHLHALRALGPDGERERASLHLVRAAALACLHTEG